MVRVGVVVMGAIALLTLAAACGGAPPEETRARTCFELLSKGEIDKTMECLPPDRREGARRMVEERATQMKGCHQQVTSAQVRTRGEGAQVLLKFKEPCGQPPSDAGDRKVTGMGMGLRKDGNNLWVLDFDRVME